jgi:hypothetical protein
MRWKRIPAARSRTGDRYRYELTTSMPVDTLSDAIESNGWDGTPTRAAQPVPSGASRINFPVGPPNRWASIRRGARESCDYEPAIAK